MRISVMILAILAVGTLSGLAAGADWLTYGSEYGYTAGWEALGALVPGCCECPPSCCDHLWDGYCQKKRCHHGFDKCRGRCRGGCHNGCRAHGCGGRDSRGCAQAGCGGCGAAP